ncbi:MAG: hypothetical protein CMJ64_17360 [Planctomycetaceae bacterium]|nr:hypothetical protein [Planctomycetaceae bacterium]
MSETFLRDGYSYGRDPFVRLRERTPVGRAGYSIRVYDLSDEQVRLDLEEALRRGVQRPLVPISCGRSDVFEVGKRLGHCSYRA